MRKRTFGRFVCLLLVMAAVSGMVTHPAALEQRNNCSGVNRATSLGSGGKLDITGMAIQSLGGRIVPMTVWWWENKDDPDIRYRENLDLTEGEAYLQKIVAEYANEFDLQVTDKNVEKKGILSYDSATGIATVKLNGSSAQYAPSLGNAVIKNNRLVVNARNVWVDLIGNVYGPYGSVTGMSDTAMDIMLENLENHASIRPGKSFTYLGSPCYRFRRGNDLVLVTKDAFLQASPRVIYPGESTVSATVALYLSTGNSEYVRCAMAESQSAAFGGIKWNFVQTRTRALRLNKFELEPQNEVMHSVSVLSYGSGLVRNGKSKDVPQPTLTVAITDTGTQPIRFGGFELSGKGKYDDKMDLANSIALGYTTRQLIGPVHGLSEGTTLSLYDDALRLADQGPAIKTYFTDAYPLYNQKTFPYRCSVRSPFKLTNNGCCYQMRVGILGTPTTATKYSFQIAHHYVHR